MIVIGKTMPMGWNMKAILFPPWSTPTISNAIPQG